MAKIPESFIEDIKNNTDIVQFIKEYTDLKKVANGVWQGACPHPKHEDSTPSFTVWEKHNSWACYGCHVGKKGQDDNFGSDVIAFVQWIYNVGFIEAITHLAKWNNVAMPTDKNQKIYDKNKKLAVKYASDLHSDANDNALEYLYNRGLDKADILKWGIGFDSYNKRIVFPLFDKYKNVIGYNKRTIIQNYRGGDKYVNSSSSEIFNKSTYLYGLHNLDNNFNEIRIAEGSMDVILAHKYGVKNVVASLGTAFTESHASMIAKTGKTPVLIFDGDEAGNTALKKAIAYFDALGVYCKVVKLPLDKDLADISLEVKDDLEEYIATKATTAGYILMKDLIANYNSSLYELKLQHIGGLKDVLSKVPLSEREEIIRFVKDELNISLN